jgi:uncharacterized protein (TIGR03083 family)
MSEATATLERSALVARVEDGRARLEAAVASVPLSRLEEPGLAGGWSVKDVLAHVAFWEEALVAQLDAAAGGPPAPSLDEDFHAVNARVQAEHRSRPLAEVRQWADRTHRSLVARLRDLPTRVLESPPAGSADPAPLWQSVPGATFEHYPEHVEAITGWLAGRAAPAA